MTFIYAVLSSYIITLVIVKGSVFLPFRDWLKTKTPKLQIPNHPHFIDCRLCVGAWVSLLVAVYCGVWQWWLPIYGLSYFLATQER